MSRTLIPIATLAAVYLLGNTLAAGDWFYAALLAPIVAAGIVILARFASPGEPTASADSSPPVATEDALATGVGE